MSNTLIAALQIGMTAARARRGGLDRYFFSLTQALPSQGVRVNGLVVGDPSDVEPSGDIRCFAPEMQPLLARWSALRRAVASALDESDVVVSHFAPYAFPVLDQVRTSPFIVHFHGPWALEGAAEGGGKLGSTIKHLVERTVYSRGDRFIVLSRAFGAILEQTYGVAPEAIRVVPGGVDLQQFRPTYSRDGAREYLAWPTGRPTVLSVRRLVHAKGLENLLDATIALRKHIPEILVVIAGTGPLEAELKRRVSESGLESSVRFTGFVSEADLPIMYRAADLFVVPTIALEGFGLVVVEALACGTPVIVTPVAGLPEVVHDLDPSLVLAGSDAKSLAHGIAQALQGGQSLPTSTECIAYAQRFDWAVIARRVAEIYREVV